MRAKLTSKNQLTLPRAVTAAVGATEYLDVQAKDGQIIRGEQNRYSNNSA